MRVRLLPSSLRSRLVAAENGQLPNRDPFAPVLQRDGTVVDQAPTFTNSLPSLSADQLAAVSGSTRFRADVVSPVLIGLLARTINALLDRVERSVAYERQLIDDAGHELRTPISIFRGELELALARPDDHLEVVASLRSAFDELARRSRLANDLLVLARSSAAEPTVRSTLIDLRSPPMEIASSRSS
jgi:signal transduction histidine kinase